jgi:hypothetical protein
MIALWFVSGLIGVLIMANKCPHGLDNKTLADKIIFITIAICALGPLMIVIALSENGD